MNGLFIREWFQNVGQQFGPAHPRAITAAQIHNIDPVALNLNSAMLARNPLVIDANVRVRTAPDYGPFPSQLNGFSPAIRIFNFDGSAHEIETCSYSVRVKRA